MASARSDRGPPRASTKRVFAVLFADGASDRMKLRTPMPLKSHCEIVSQTAAAALQIVSNGQFWPQADQVRGLNTRVAMLRNAPPCSECTATTWLMTGLGGDGGFSHVTFWALIFAEALQLARSLMRG
jgi:hypothetical protein